MQAGSDHPKTDVPASMPGDVGLASGVGVAREIDGEDARLAALERLLLLDTAPEEAYDDLVVLASEVCQAPVALLSLIDRDRQWFKAQVGLEAEETARDLSFCAHALAEPGELFTVADASMDPRFADNPLVTGEPGIRFYAGAPIVTEDGHALGTVCVIDTKPRVLSRRQERCLKALARQAAGIIDLRRRSLEAAQVALTQVGMTAEARLKQEQGSELLDLVLRGRSLGLWVLDVQSGRWTASAHELAMLGYDDGDPAVASLDWRALVHPEDRSLATSSMAPHLRGETPFYECQLRMRHRAGRWIWILSRAVVVERDEAGVPSRIVGTHMDVTERRRLDDERQQNAERLELALAGGDIGLWDVHLATGEVVYNEHWAATIGYTLAEVEGSVDLWKSVMHPDDRGRYLAAVGAHLRGELAMVEGEGRMRHRDGRWVWLHLRAKAFGRDAGGRPVRIVGTNFNITNRKLSEMALQDEMARRRVLVEQASEFVFVLTKDMRVAEANRSFAAALGYSTAEVMALRPWDWDALDTDRECFGARWSGHAAASWNAETTWRRKDGSRLDVAMSCTRIAIGDHEERLFVCRDITDTRRDRLALEHAQHLLEQTGRLARVGGWELDLLASTVVWSAEVYRIHEVEPGWKPTLANAIDFYAPEARPVIRAAVEAAIADGTPWDLQLPLTTARGRRVWVRAIGRVEYDGSRPVRLAGAFQDITDRKEVEEALSRSEQRLTLALECSRQSIFDWDVAGDVVHLSAQMALVRGYDASAVDLSFADFVALLHPEDRAGFAEASTALVSGLSPSFENEHRIGHRDGRWIWIRSVGRVSRRGVDGRATRVSAIDEEVTARKTAEQAVADSERRLRTITDNMPALIMHIDNEQRYGFVNAHFGRVFGIPPKAVIGKTMQAVCGDALYADIAPYIARALQGESLRFEATGPAKGDLLHYESHYIPDFDADGAVAGFYALIFDVTARKHAELKSRESEKRLRGIADNLPALIAEVAADGTFRFANATYRSWLGLDHEAIVGQSLRASLGDRYYLDRNEEIERALRGEQVSFERPMPTAHGLRTLMSTYVPYFDNDGAVGGFYGLTSDITELKDTQRKLDALARNDALTGIPNRRHFEEHAREAIARARRATGVGALFYIDIDYFKAINDSLGHAIGDEVLQEFAARLSGCFRQTDFVARYAGDEFIAIAEGVGCARDAEQLAAKVIAEIRRPFLSTGVGLRVSTSVGVALFDGGETLQVLLERADGALYDVKARGRDGHALALRADTADERSRPREGSATGR